MKNLFQVLFFVALVSGFNLNFANAMCNSKLPPHPVKFTLANLSSGDQLILEAFQGCNGYPVVTYPSSTTYPSRVSLISKEGITKKSLQAPDNTVFYLNGKFVFVNDIYMQVLPTGDQSIRLFSFKDGVLQFSKELIVGTLPESAQNMTGTEGVKRNTAWDSLDRLAFINYYPEQAVASVLRINNTGNGKDQWDMGETVFINLTGEIVHTIKNCISATPLQNGRLICYDHIAEKQYTPYAFGLNELILEINQLNPLISNKVEAFSPPVALGNEIILAGIDHLKKNSISLNYLKLESPNVYNNAAIVVTKGQALTWLNLDKVEGNSQELRMEFGSGDNVVNYCLISVEKLKMAKRLLIDNSIREFRGIPSECTYTNSAK